MKKELLSCPVPYLPTCAVFSRRTRVVYAGGNPLVVYPSQCTPEVPSVSYSGGCDALRLSIDERNLAIAAGPVVKILDLGTGRELRNLSGHSLPVKALCPRRSSIYAWISGSLDSSWIVWDMRCHPANVLSARTTGPVRCVDVSPDDRVLAVGSDSALQLYDIRNRMQLRHFPASTTGVAIHPVHTVLASYGLDKMVRFWCLDQLECIGVSEAFDAEVRGISFSPYMDLLIAVTDRSLRVCTYEPYDIVETVALPDFQKVLHISMTDQDEIEMVSLGTDSSLSIYATTLEEALGGSSVSVETSPEAVIADSTEDQTYISPEITNISPVSEVSAPESDSPIHSVDDLSLEEDLSPSEGSSTGGDPREGRSSSGSEHEPLRRSNMSVAAVQARRRDLPDIVLPPVQQRIQRQREAARGERERRSSLNAAVKDRKTRNRMDSARARSPPSKPVHHGSTNDLKRRPDSLNGSRTRLSEPRIPSDSRGRDTSGRAIRSEKSTPVRTRNDAHRTGDDNLWNSIDKAHHITVVRSEKRILELQQLQAWSRRGGVSSAARQGANDDEDGFVVFALVKSVTEHHKWDLTLCSQLLPGLKGLLIDASAVFREAALDGLTDICTSLLERLKSCSRAQSSIGVDVAAEERKTRADGCLKELRELRDKRESYYKKMAEDDVYRLDAVMVFLKNI